MRKWIKHLFPQKKPHCTAILVAGGSSSRMEGTDKITASLGGMTVLERSALALEQNPLVQELVVVTRRERMEEVSRLLHGLSKLTLVVPGGSTRAASVEAGLAAVSRKTRLVAIHDAARPLVSQSTITKVIEAGMKTGAATPAIPVKDTVKAARDGIVTQTPDRSTLFAVQTPQVFDADLLRAAHAKAKKDGVPLTDDCVAVERIGGRVLLTQGEERNLKITTPIDLKIAKLLLEDAT